MRGEGERKSTKDKISDIFIFLTMALSVEQRIKTENKH